MDLLKGKVAIVTGASSGIGRAAAFLFAKEGARVVATARRTQELSRLLDEIAADGGEAISLAGDLREEDFVLQLTTTTIERFGGIDIAFNNAGDLGQMKPTMELSLESWQKTLDANLTSAFLCAKYQLPSMIERGGGSIVFTSSFVGNTAGFPGMAAYAAAKAGVVGLVRVLAAEYGARGIRANALLPGGTDTPMNIARLPEAAAGTQEFVEGLHALKRMASPEEIAAAALFLLSEAASFVTGTAFLADGGVSIYRA